MALESPLKKDVLKARRDIELLNRKYNMYFSGADEDMPREFRKQLGILIDKIKAATAIASSTADKFLANSVIAQFQINAAKWDKTLKLIEDGRLVIPKKRD